MKFVWTIYYNKRILFQNLWRKWRETSFRPLFVFKKALNEVKAADVYLSLNTF